MRIKAALAALLLLTAVSIPYQAKAGGGADIILPIIIDLLTNSADGRYTEKDVRRAVVKHVHHQPSQKQVEKMVT